MFSSIAEEVQADLIHRVATLETVQPDALARIRKSYAIKIQNKYISKSFICWRNKSCSINYEFYKAKYGTKGN